MKRILLSTLLMLFGIGALAQQIVIVSEVKCVDQDCSIGASCVADLKAAIATFATSNPFGCSIDGTSCYTNCNAIPPQPSCFNKTYLNSLSSDGWLNFSDTPVGLSTFKKIKVFHYAKDPLGGSGLDFNPGSIEFNSGSSSDFTIIDVANPASTITGGSTTTLPYTETSEFWVRFTPSSPGNKTATITVGAGCELTNIRFNGDGIARVAKQVILTMDRSGSMSEPFNGISGGTPKLDLLKVAAGLFLDLGESGDTFGGVSYSSNTDSRALGTSVADLKTWIGGFTPGTTTAIGKGVRESFKVLNGGSNTVCNSSSDPQISSANKIVVLLTDGIENVSPYVDQAKNPHLGVPCFKQGSIYTIGFGEGDQLNEAMLSYLPQLSAFTEPAINGDRGYYHVDSDITIPGGGIFDLNAAYYKIYASANDVQNVVDPTVEVSLFDSLPQIIHKAAITTSDLRATFAVFEQPNLQQYYDLELQSPDGQAVVSGAMPNGLAVTLIQANGYRVYKIDFSGAATPAAFAGTWNLSFTPKGTMSARKEVKGSVPIGFAVSAFSNLRMRAQAEATIATPGNSIRYVLRLDESGLPLAKVSLKAQVKTPSGQIVPLTVVKDNAGNWVADFSNTFEPGTYEVYTRAVVYNRKGEVATREGTQFIAMVPPAIAEPETPCFSCTWWYVFGIIVLLMLILLILILRKR